MKTKDELNAYKQKDNDALAIDLKEKKSELMNLRFQLATGQLENTAAIAACKKDIARIMTIMRQNEMAKNA